MTKLPLNYEIPAEMRDFAEKSVEQAKKAFDGFLGAATKAASAVETQATTVQTNSKELATKAFSYAEQNVGAAFELAQKLVRAKDLQEVLAHQSEFLKSQAEAMQAQAKEIGAHVQASVTKAASEVQANMQKVTAEAQDTIKKATEAATTKKR